MSWRYSRIRNASRRMARGRVIEPESEVVGVVAVVVVEETFHLSLVVVPRRRRRLGVLSDVVHARRVVHRRAPIDEIGRRCHADRSRARHLGTGGGTRYRVGSMVTEVSGDEKDRAGRNQPRGAALAAASGGHLEVPSRTREPAARVPRRAESRIRRSSTRPRSDRLARRFRSGRHAASAPCGRARVGERRTTRTRPRVRLTRTSERRPRRARGASSSFGVCPHARASRRVIRAETGIARPAPIGVALVGPETPLRPDERARRRDERPRTYP